MNNDLISRSALLKEIKLQKSYAGEMRQASYKTGYLVSLSVLEGKIADMQDVDAEPVRHGRWILGEPNMFGNRPPKCSACGKYRLYQWADHVKCNFCPNCGAKMDTEANE